MEGGCVEKHSRVKAEFESELELWVMVLSEGIRDLWKMEEMELWGMEVGEFSEMEEMELWGMEVGELSEMEEMELWGIEVGEFSEMEKMELWGMEVG